jgi:chitinase
MLSDELTIVSKIQKHLKDNYHSIGENMMAGGVDNMEKYKYMLGQAHAYINILQEISNLLNPKKEDKNEQRNNVIKFGNPEN